MPEKKFEWCISKNLLSEYHEVLQRPKFSKYPNFTAKAETILIDIESVSTMYIPQLKLDIILDADDNMLLELADECDADFLITGNTNDFTITTYKSTQIVTPKQYWENYHPG